MNQKRVYKSYQPSFKEEAVALVTDQGKRLKTKQDSHGKGLNKTAKTKQDSHGKKNHKYTVYSLGIRLVDVTGRQG